MNDRFLPSCIRAWSPNGLAEPPSWIDRISSVSQQAYEKQQPRRSGIGGAARATGALFVLTAGAIHLWLYFDYFHAVHVLGALFLVNAASASAVAVVLLASDHPIGLLAGLGYAVGTIAAFLISVYHGLFGYVESLRGPWQEAAGLLELAAVVILLPLLIASARRRAYPSTPDAAPSRSRGPG